MLRRSLVPLLAIAAVAVIVPSAALSRSGRQSDLPPGFSATFTAASARNTYTLTFTVGQEALCAVVFGLPDAARQAGALIVSATASQGTVAYPNGATSPYAAFGVLGQLQPGQTVTVTFQTAQPFPANAGAELTSLVCGSQASYIADITGPAAPAAPQPPPPPPSHQGPQRAPLPPKAGQPIRFTLPIPPAGEVAAGMLKVPLTAAQQKVDGKPDVGVRVAVERPGSLPSGVSIEAAAAETARQLVISFVIPHVLKNGQKPPTNDQFTFDTTLFTSCYPGPAGRSGPGATVDVYLFDNSTEKPLLAEGNEAIVNPCGQFPQSRKVGIRIDDLITASNPHGGSSVGDCGQVKVGFGVLIVGGSSPDGVNLQGFVVNSHTGGFDLSVFGVKPEALRPPAAPPAAATKGAGDLVCKKPTPEANALTAAVRGG